MRPRPCPDRRDVLAALGVGLAAPGFVLQPPPGDDPVAIRLTSNLFTRVGAEVFIDGRGPHLFVIDTGAGVTAIAEDLASSLELSPGPEMIVHGVTGAYRAQSVGIRQLELNGLNFRDLRSPVFTREHLGADGLIGLDVMGRYRLSFNVERRTASLAVPGIQLEVGSRLLTGSRLGGRSLRAARGRFGHMVTTQVMVEGEPTAAFVDSGAQYSVGNTALQRAVAARRPGPGRFGQAVSLYGVAGQTLSADLAQVDDLRIGPSRLGVTPLLFADLHCFQVLGLAERPTMLIGADVLSRFRSVLLDFPKNTLSFTGLRRPSTSLLNHAAIG